ncbi:MAG TPA: methionine--tRNA ligase [Candidatus Nanoarchaeia archaeon]|nr:methionine--tRNA ligase [Candidatus Nanoarchaeia archaeon]
MINFAKSSSAKQKFYVTTAIDYTNSSPHCGHAYQKVAADVQARWHRSLGYKVFFLTGTDEHGLKILRAAENAGKPVKQFVDELSQEFKEAWKALNIDYDRFIRTTDVDHKKKAQQLIKRMVEDIYRGVYKGSYCVGCENYLGDDDIVDGKCKIHHRPVEYLEEETYFFKLSKYAAPLLDYYKEHPDFVRPSGRLEEVRQRILREGLKDLSVSRVKFQWGVPFPLDRRHSTYVWFEALQSYITGINWPGAKFKTFWPADYQHLGKDNLWFHAVIWPAMLMSLGLPLPKTIAVNGWITVNGEKISKSLGNVIDPKYLAKKYGADPVRYYLLRECPYGEDLDFSEVSLISRHNAELADELGNLVSRVLTLIERFSGNKVPRAKKQKKDDVEIIWRSEDAVRHASEHMQKLEYHKALEKIWAYITVANKYVGDEKPWELAKKNDPHLNTVLYNLGESLRIITALVWPFIPETAEKISQQLGLKTVPGLKGLKWGQLKAGTTIAKGDILFEKIDAERIGVVEPFEKLDLRVAEVMNVEEVKGAEKLYKLKLNVGRAGFRQIVAGVKQHYKPMELKGKRIVIISNLKPAKIKGVESQGMLLAAEDKSGNVGILRVDETEPGADVFIVGMEKKPVENLDLNEFIKVTLTTRGNSVYYKDKFLQTYKEKVHVEKAGEGGRVR